jgi:hypothetical protein
MRLSAYPHVRESFRVIERLQSGSESALRHVFAVFFCLLRGLAPDTYSICDCA